MREDNFEREFEAALAKYAAVDPRTGLENRVLESLRAERARGRGRASWWWSAPAALVLAVSIAIVLMLSGGASTRNAPGSGPVVANQGAAPIETQSAIGLGTGGSGLEIQIGNLREHPNSGKRATADSRSNQFAVRPNGEKLSVPVRAESYPKLEQFPAPEPLSEQEKLLMRYVESDPENAQLVADAIALAEQYRWDVTHSNTDLMSESGRTER